MGYTPPGSQEQEPHPINQGFDLLGLTLNSPIQLCPNYEQDVEKRDGTDGTPDGTHF